MALLLPHAVTAATYVWDANTGTIGAQDGAGTWSLSGLDWWSQGAAAGSNVAITSADIASFGAGGAGGTVTLNANQSVSGLNFGFTTTTGYSLTASGPTTLTLGTSGITMLTNAQAATVGDANLSLVLGASQSWFNRSAAALTIGGGVNLGANTLTLRGLSTLNGALTGAGSLALGAAATTTANAANNFSGTTTLGNGATLALSGANGALTATSGLILNNGTLTLDNTTTANADRVAGNAITVNGSSAINFNVGATASYSETLGAISLPSGALSLTSGQTGTGFTSVLTSALAARNATDRGTVTFLGTGLGATGNAQNRLLLAGQAAGDIGPWAIYANSDFAQYSTTTDTGFARGVIASASTTLAVGSNSATTNFKETGSISVTASLNPEYKSLAISTGTTATLTVGTNVIYLVGGGLYAGNGANQVITGTTGSSSITTGAKTSGTSVPLYVTVGDSGTARTLTVTNTIVTNNPGGGALDFVKGGAGILAYSGTALNTYTGATIINQGTLSSGATVGVNFNGSAPSFLGASSNVAANLVLNGGTLRYAGPTLGTTDRLFTVGPGGGGIANQAASNGTLDFTNPGSLVASGTGDRTLTISGNGTGATTFVPIIVNPSSGLTSLTTSQTSTGVIILNPSGPNTFTGGINVSAGILRVFGSNALGANEVAFNGGQLDLYTTGTAANTNFSTLGSSFFFGNTSGTTRLGNTTTANGFTMTVGPVTLGSGTWTISHGGGLNTNTAHSLTTGAVTLTGNPTIAVSNSNGSATTVDTLGALNDGGVARTITVTGGGGGTSNGPRLTFGTAAAVFTAGTNLVLSPTISSGGNLRIRLTNASGFGTAANNGLISITGANGGIEFLNNTSPTTFNTNVAVADVATTFVIGGTSAQNARSLVAGTLSTGSGVVTIAQTNANSNQAHSLTFGATTFTGNTTFSLTNVNGTGTASVGSLILGALNDGGVARAIVKNGAGTLQLNTAATSLIAGTTITATGSVSATPSIVQIGNNTALGSGTLVLGDGTSSGQLLVAAGTNLSNASTITYAGGFLTVGTGVIVGPATGTGTISSSINLNSADPSDSGSGHFAGGGGTLNIAGPIITGGTSNNEVVIFSGNVGLNNATGNTYTSLRVRQGTTTIGVDNAIPTAANVALGELGATALNFGSFNQTIAAGAKWTLGGSGPTLENNVATVATGTGTLTLSGTLANNTGSLATQLVTGAISFAGGSGTFDIDSGHATSDLTVSASLSNGSLIKTGAGILNLTGTKNLTGLTINGGTVTGGYGTAGVGTISVGTGGALWLVNGAAETLTLGATPSALNVAGGARLGFELGAPGTSDRLIVGAGGTAATNGTITLDFFNLGALAAGTYTLLSADSGLMPGGTSYSVGSAPLGFNYQINASDTLVQLVTTAYTPRFWTGSQATSSWSTVNAGPLTNWASNAAGTLNSTDVPVATHTVIFSAANAVGPAINTTLDAPFTIDALQFLAAPTGVNAVNLAAGTGGTLAISPATSSAGIYVDTNAGTATFAAGLPITAGAAQTWNVVGGGANGSALVMAADVAFNAPVTKSGAGALTLSGTNSGSASLTLAAGTLNLNSAGALGSGTFNIGGGTTINNSTASAITLSANNPISLNGNFTFTGTSSLNLGAGPTTLTTNASITSTANNLTFGGAIGQTGGARSLTKLGVGALTLNGSNTFTGGVNLNAGTLNLGNAAALGTGTLIITSGTLDNTSGGALTLSTNNPQIWNGNFAFTGTNALNLGTGDVDLGSGAGTTRTVTVNAGTLTVGGAISNGAVGTGLTKTGAGALILSGASTFTGNLTVSQGTLNLGGSWTGNPSTTGLIYGGSAVPTIVNVTGNATLRLTTGGNASGAVAVYNQTAGTVRVTPGSGNIQYVAAAAGSYGYFNLTGGTYDISGTDPSGVRGRFSINNGQSVAAATPAVSVVYVGGTGFLDNRNGDWMLNYSHGQVTVGPGGIIDRTGAANPYGIAMNSTAAGGVYGVLNVAGGTALMGAKAIQFGNSTSTGNGNGNVAFINLGAGTLGIGTAMTSSLPTGGGNTQYINFAGGTLKFTSATTAWIPGSTANIAYNTTIFGAIDNSAVAGAPSFNGGLVVDTGGVASTLTNIIAGATGAGVRQADLTLSSGSSYIGAPEVIFSSAGVVTGGTPATGYALISGGAVTGIVITNPGTYTAGTTPTVTLSGGLGVGGTAATVTAGALNTLNDTTAGLTVSGAGQLTLSGVNTYTGVNTVNGAGTVLSATTALNNIGVAGGLGTGNATSDATNAASLVFNGGTLRMSVASATATDRLFTLTPSGGVVESNNGTAANTFSLTNAGKAVVMSGSGARTLTLGGVNTGSNVFALDLTDGAGGATTLAKAGAGKWIVTGTGNTFTGGTNIAAGTLAFDAGTLGSTGNITFTGSGTLQWNGTNTTDVSSRLVLTSGFTGTIDTNGNNLTFANGLATTGGTAAVLAKVGAGTLTLNGAATHTGGTTLSAGGLNIGHASALGAGTFTIASTGPIDNTSGGALTLAGNPAQAWNSDFTFTGTNSLDLGTGNVTLSANRTVTVNAGTLTVGGVIDDGAGNFTFTKAGAGSLYLKGANTFGSNTAVNVNGGTLIVDSNTGLGDATNDINFGGAATLRFNGNATFGPGQYFRIPGAAVTIDVASGALVQVNSTNTGSATNGISTSTATGASVIKTGAGTLQLNGSQGFYDGTGGWVVQQGTLSLAGTSNAVLGDSTAGVGLHLAGGTVSYDTDLSNIVNSVIATSVEASSTLVNNLATPGAGIAQQINALTFAGNYTLNLQGGANVNSGTAAFVAGATTLNGNASFNITNPVAGGTTQLSLGPVTGNANAITLTGNGDLVQTGAIASSAATALTLGSGYAGLATLSQANSYSGVTQVNGGTLAFSTSGNLGNASATNTIGLGGGKLRYTGTSTLDLTANRVVALSPGTTSIIEVPGTTANLQLTGGISTASAASFTKAGPGTLTVSGSTNLNGGTLSVADGTLRLTLAATGTGAISLASTAVLALTDNSAVAVTLGTSANALALTGGARLGLELGASGTNDSITVGTGGTALTNGGVITFDFSALSGFGVGNYTLLSAASGLLQGNVSYVTGLAPAGFNYVITATDSLVSLQTTLLSNRYWNGLQSASWSTVTVDPFSNFTTDAAGTTNSGTAPTAADTVIFSASNAAFTSGTSINTTLDAAYTIDSLQFLNVPGTISTVSIASGTGGVGSTLTLAPVSPTNGITVAANGGAVAISAPVIVGAPQMWAVNGTGTSSLALTGGVTFNQTVTKTGAGAVTLSGAGGGTGGFNLSAGTLNLNHNAALGSGTLTIGPGTTIDNTSASAVTLVTNNAQSWGGSFNFNGTQALNLGTGAVTLGNNVTLTTAAGTLTVGGAIGDGGSNRVLTKAGAGALTLAGANTFTGGVNLTAGTLNLAHAAALGTGPLTITSGTLDNTSGAALTLSTNNAQTWSGAFAFTGTKDLNLGTGAVLMGASSSVSVAGAASTLTVGGTVTGLPANTLTKSGPGTLVLNGLSAVAANNYAGTTILDGGTLSLGSAAALTGGVTFGASSSSTNPSTLNTGGNNLNLGGALLSQVNSATANTIALATGSLTTGAAVTIGPAGTGVAHRLVLTGSSWTANGSVTFRVGGSASVVSTTALDLSGLSSFTANLGTGAFVLGSSDTGSVTDTGTTVTLPAAATITAANVRVGLSTHSGPHTLSLGSGATTINSDTLSVAGIAGGTYRSNGTLSFAGTSGGTLTLRASNGTGAAAVNLINTDAGTNSAIQASLLLAGHSADLSIGTLTMASRNPSASWTSAVNTATLTFDQGTFNAATIVASNRAATGGVTSGRTIANLTFGGGTVTVGTLTLSLNATTNAGTTGNAEATLTISGSGTNSFTTVSMGNNTQTDATATGGTLTTANISGGTTTIGTLNMAANNAGSALTTATTAASTLNLSGGTVNVTGNISMGASTNNPLNVVNNTINITGTGALRVDGNINYGGVGVTTATINVDGGSLDMTNGNIGSGTVPITLNLKAGTLSNVATYNSGGAINKTTAGVATISGANSFVGPVNVAAGVLVAGSNSGFGTSAGGVTVTSGAQVNLANGVTVSGETITINGNGIATDITGTPAYTALRGALQADNAATATWAGPVVLGSDGSRLGAQAGGTLTVSGVIDDGANNFALEISPSPNNGLVILSGANTYHGDTRVIRGVLKLGANNSLPAATLLDLHSSAAITSDSTLDLNGFNQTIAALQRSANDSVAISKVTNGAIGATSTLTVSGSTSTNFGDATHAAFIENGAGTVALAKSGSGTLTLFGTQTYTGATSVTGGTLALGSNGSLSTGLLDVGAAGVFIATNTAAGSALPITAAVTNNGSVTFAANQTIATLNGTTAAATLNQTGTLNVSGGGSYAGAITGSGALTVSGGTLTVSGANSYAGDTTVSGGTLKLGAANAIPNGASAGNVAVAGTLDLNGFDDTLNGLSGAGTIDNTGAGSATLAIGDHDQASTFGGTIKQTGGALTLTKVGSGKLILSGTTTATLTDVQAGTLELRGSISGNIRMESFGFLDVTNLPNGTVPVAAGGFLQNGGAVSGSASVDGTVSGTGSFSGNLTANSGGAVAPGANGVGTLTAVGSLTMNAGSSLNIELSGNPLALSDLVVASSISLDTAGAGVTLNLSLLPSAALEGNGSVFFIASNTGAGFVSGAFANPTTQMSFDGYGGETFTVLGSPVGANNSKFAISYDANIATGAFHGGNDVAVMAVPEPSAALRLLVGSGLLLGLHRRRRKA